MVCIITINFNLASETIPCVNSVLESDYDNIKVYVIDNGSIISDFNKLSNEFYSNPKVELTRIEHNLGYVKGVNFGIKRASEIEPEYYMIMNNDTVIDNRAISYLLEASKRYNNQAIISGKVFYFDQPDILQHTGVMFSDKRFLKTSYPGRNEIDIGQCEIEAERDSLDDVFWLLPASIIKDVGYYSDYFYLYAEQGDYAQRAKRKGYKLIYTPNAKLWHKTSMSTGNGDAKALPICYWRGQGRFIFQYRNLKRHYFIQLMILSFIRYVSKSLLLKGMARKQAYATLRGYFYGFKWLFNKVPNSGYNPYLHLK